MINKGSIVNQNRFKSRSIPAVVSMAMQQDGVSKHGGGRAAELQTVLLIQTVPCGRMDQDQDLNQDQDQAVAHAAR